jgi:hypothetical protein
MGQTIAFVNTHVRQQVEKLGLKPRQARLFLEKLIPAQYLERIAAKRSKKEGSSLRATAANLAASAFAADGPFQNLGDFGKSLVEFEARRLAGVFQRSSSAVEGRNGVLSFRHHGLRGLPLRKRRCLTALHNFFIERVDGTTAAERFFDARPRDLFHAVLATVDVPRRPKRPARKPGGGAAMLN